MTTESVTVLFTDMVGSTALATSLAPDAADEFRREHFSILRQAVAEAGGTEVKNLGDGLMVVFGSASAALSCAVAMQQGVERDNRARERTVGLRVGLSVGDVSREDDDYFGEPVIEAARSAFLIGGTVGPRGDGYRIDSMMDADVAADYHSFQIDCMAAAGVDVVTALTMGYTDEAVGIARAAQAAGLPVVVSFTLETDGTLPSGMSLREAIDGTDAATAGYPVHYMINCAHPAHFDHVLDGTAPWAARIGGLRANASQLSHAELDEMVELDEGDPDDLAARYVSLRSALPGLQVIGGCCGTDQRHVAAIAHVAWRASVVWPGVLKCDTRWRPGSIRPL